jgi:hypothetical protein
MKKSIKKSPLSHQESQPDGEDRMPSEPSKSVDRSSLSAVFNAYKQVGMQRLPEEKRFKGRISDFKLQPVRNGSQSVRLKITIRNGDEEWLGKEVASWATIGKLRDEGWEINRPGAETVDRWLYVLGQTAVTFGELESICEEVTSEHPSVDFKVRYGGDEKQFLNITLLQRSEEVFDDDEG